VNRDRLEESVGYRFSRPELLDQALTHRSHGSPHNERLEFLGDSVLNCVIAAEVFARFSSVPEGDLHLLRKDLVREQGLCTAAQALKLEDHIRLGESGLSSGVATRPSVIADALEALIGAIFLDGGFDVARKVVVRLYEPLLAGLDPHVSRKDPKTLLQELLQARRVRCHSTTCSRRTGACMARISRWSA
jgi:ribonuclease-3